MFIRNSTVSKIVLDRVKDANNKLVLFGRNVLVVGGTGGIGAAAALKFAQLGASVTIAGRNKQNGAAMLDAMRAVSPNKDIARFHYISVDITIMKDVKRFTSELITSGGVNYGSKRDTPEGIEHNFAISYLGRFLVINRAPEGGRAMSVLSAGTGANIEDLNDIEMKKKGAYSKIRSGYTNCACNDLMMEELSRQTKGHNI